MPGTTTLGEFEQLVLLALLRLGRDAYGATVTTEIEAQSGRVVSVAAVHTTLDRLEQKGLTRSRLGEPTPQRGGKRKRHYEITAAGVRTLQHSVRALRRMVKGSKICWEIRCEATGRAAAAGRAVRRSQRTVRGPRRA